MHILNQEKKKRSTSKYRKKNWRKISFWTVLRIDIISTVQMFRRILPLRAARLLEKTPFASPRAHSTMSKRNSLGTPPWLKSAIKIFERYAGFGLLLHQ